MPTYTINSYCYYSISTDIISGDISWTRQAESGSTPGYLASGYAETGASDNALTPNEILDPDYSAANATYLGTFTHGGQVFLVFEDQFGQLLGSPDMNVPYASWPASLDPDTIDATVTPICFAAGSMIATPTGEAAVETLSIGDLVTTTGGGTTPVLWVGHHKLPRVLLNARMLPVRIQAAALGNGLPHSDLTVTADHGMVIDGLVINAAALVNNDTIDFMPMAEMKDQMTVYHIETEAHDVILANGAPSETFIDYADRKGFDNYDEYLSLYGADRLIPEMDTPRISSARDVPQTIKDRLNQTTVAMDWTLTA